MRELTELWVDAQAWLFDTFVSPVLFHFGLMAWYEPGYNAVEFIMLGVVQIAIIAVGMRFFERRWPLEKSSADDRLIRVDQVYTVLNKLGIVPLAIFIVTYPLVQHIELSMRTWGFAPPRLERILPWLGDNALASFLVYFILYDFAAYWLHRAQHGFAWWWSLHSLHHSQRRMTVWTDDRNHVVDDLLINLALVLFSQVVGVQPGEYVLILMIGRLVESWSHANVDMSFGRLGERLLVGPRFHRLHHALSTPEERHIQDHNFAPVFPIWDILFGTAIYDGKHRPTGVDDPVVDADNGRGWITQQVTVLGRLVRALVPGLRRSSMSPGLRPPAE
ncbi:sterol desaturase family protein [Reyranella sp.]|uniref:sterol desaturase family protein n=1 Tax=Reyranella sp. TaxID=1929291 RepID=UPI001215C52B|nr:sterol desaturase family protein [Reyranella sp.]TAJ89859.1 MAG: fatty acid hydroxylase family protein [Reyranella sp.]